MQPEPVYERENYTDVGTMDAEDFPTGKTVSARDEPDDMPTSFTAQDGRYTFSALDGMIELTVDSLRRERYNLIGELEACCHLVGASTYGERRTLLVTTLNCSNAKARQDVAGLLATRARTRNTVDWQGYLEHFTQRIWAAERSGTPSQLLHEIPPSDAEATFDTHGFTLLVNHPQIIFAPGGTGKSLEALLLLGELERRGVRTLILDWEMDGGEQRLRADAANLPKTVRYRRCDQPLILLAESIRRDVLNHGVDFLLLDSIAPACNGRVEDAETAIEFMKAWRRIGKGGVAIAHTRAEDGEQRPFGSVFWHNMARSTWFLKRVGEQASTNLITLGVYHRKANFGPLRPPFGLELSLENETDQPGILRHVSVRRINIAEVGELSASLPLWQRMRHALRPGAKTIAELADELEAKPDSVKKALERSKGRTFTCLTNNPDGVHRWALVERRTA